MSEKNFVAYGDAESILTGYANRIKQSPTTFVGTQAQWDALSSSQKAEYELVDITDDSLSPSGHVDWESFGELGAVNLFDFTINSTVAKGITFVQNSDGTVTVSGSNTQGSGVGILTKVQMLKKGTYILSGCPSITNGVLSLQLSDEPTLIGLIAEAKNGQEVTFTLASDTNVKIQYYANAIASITGSVTIKPMIRLATDSDSTYQPYAMTNKELTKQVSPIDDMNNILGAKNLLPVTMVSQALSGVTFTVDASSGVISVSGSNSGSPFSDVLGITTLTPGTYKVTTGQTPELNAQIGIAITDASSGTIIARSWNGTEVFTISSNTQVKFHIEVNVTGAITSTSIYPMCRPLSIKDEKYVPYASTNRELSSQIQAYTNIVNITDKFTKPSTTLSFEAYKVGRFVYVLTTFKPTAIGFTHIATFNDPNLDPINVMYSHGINSDGKTSNNWARAQTGVIEGFVYEQADLPTYFTEFSLIYLCRG